MINLIDSESTGSARRNRNRWLFGYLVLAVIVGLVAVLVLNISHPNKPAATTPPPTAGVVSGRGGNGARPVPIASSLPDFPLPPGTVTGSTGATPSWTIGLNSSGGYAKVMAGLRAFYLSKGYDDLNPSAVIPTRFENATYQVTLVGRSHDHSDTSTDVVIAVHGK